MSGELNILKKLFKEIIIPDAVYEEVVVKGKEYPTSDIIKRQKWINTESIHNYDLYHNLHGK